MSLTPKQYDRRIQRLLRDVGRLERDGVRQSMDLLRVLGRRVNAEVAATDFARFQVGNVRRAVGDVVTQFGAQYEAMLDRTNDEVLRLAREFHDDLAAAAGRSLGAPVVSIPQLEIVRNFRADLIRKMEAETIGRISTEINLGVLGGKSPFEIQQAIKPFVQPLRRRDGSTVGILARVETLARTEVNRVFALTAHSQLQNDAAALEAIGEKPLKAWNTAGDDRVRDSHVEAGRRYGIGGDPGPIPIDEPFIVDGEELRFPLDPLGSPGNTIGCRCTATVVSPSVVEIGKALAG